MRLWAYQQTVFHHGSCFWFLPWVPISTSLNNRLWRESISQINLFSHELLLVRLFHHSNWMKLEYPRPRLAQQWLAYSKFMFSPTLYYLSAKNMVFFSPYFDFYFHLLLLFMPSGILRMSINKHNKEFCITFSDQFLGASLKWILCVSFLT